MSTLTRFVPVKPSVSFHLALAPDSANIIRITWYVRGIALKNAMSVWFSVETDQWLPERWTNLLKWG